MTDGPSSSASHFYEFAVGIGNTQDIPVAVPRRITAVSGVPLHAIEGDPDAQSKVITAIVESIAHEVKRTIRLRNHERVLALTDALSKIAKLDELLRLYQETRGRIGGGRGIAGKLKITRNGVYERVKTLDMKFVDFDQDLVSLLEQYADVPWVGIILEMIEKTNYPSNATPSADPSAL